MFRDTELGTRKSIIFEGSNKFAKLRDCMLREAERSLFLAISHYRRSFDLMISSSAHWSYVTQYYGTWYAANAFLLMFGCYKFKRYLIDVKMGNEGNQQLQYWKIGKQSGQFIISGNHSGSHREFWYIFYEGVAPIRGIVDAKYQPCLSPISHNKNWLIEKRNEINYTTKESVSALLQFQNSFTTNTFPQCLSGNFSTQYSILELLLELTCKFAKQFNIFNDSIDKLMPSKSFSEIVSEKIFNEKAPNLVRKSIKSKII